jgi:hypothetical protein
MHTQFGNEYLFSVATLFTFLLSYHAYFHPVREIQLGMSSLICIPSSESKIKIISDIKSVFAGKKIILANNLQFLNYVIFSDIILK